MAFTNRLIHETSPYLQQHAHNPVDWYPWGPEALEKARREDRPILVSIGYAACHWCHVMEKESFEDPATAELMNTHFVNIKIDREERPDLDNIYMDAVQTMTGSGGWPLNVFLTPDAKPFYGGTYFPPRRAFNRPSWKEVLQGVMGSYRERRDEIDAQAAGLTHHLATANLFGIADAAGGAFFDAGDMKTVCGKLLSTADRRQGGFGGAPKFPQVFSIRFLLACAHYFKNEEALAHACLSLDKMIYGGIFDQLGGGFARYATDNAWLVPHFEKMLYDNALLVQVLSEAFQFTRKPQYANAIGQTMEFIVREMLSGEGGFYAALDADSEGEEGKYYVWDKAEVDALLGNASPMFCAFYGITEAGNWEGKNILHVPADPAGFAADHGLTVEALFLQMADSRKKLLEVRGTRPRPQTDDKLLLGWNALMNTACSKAFAATGEEAWRQLAIRNMDFLLSAFRDGEDRFFHTRKKNVARFPAFIDDYAFLVQALLQLQEITGNQDYLSRARGIMEAMMPAFADPDAPYFFYTPANQGDVLFRKKEVYDGATPSGNATMAGNLIYLSIVFDRSDWRERAEEMSRRLWPAIKRYPGSFGAWSNLCLEMTMGMKEIVVAGRHFNQLHHEILQIFLPGHVLVASAHPSENIPLLKDKDFSSVSQVYLCRNFACNPPVTTTADFLQLIDN